MSGNRADLHTRVSLDIKVRYGSRRRSEILSLHEVAGWAHCAGRGGRGALFRPSEDGPELGPSCTHALELAALLLDIQPGDEVIVPSFTFVSTVNAFVLRGAKPVFADVRPDTLNIDESQIERLITPKTKAIVVVHYAGVGCEMDAVMAIAAAHRVAVIEDNAHGLFGKYRGK